MAGRRKERRVRLRLPVRVWGLDRDGQFFSNKAYTVDVTTSGARVQGITAGLRKGALVNIEQGRSSSRFRVQWVGGTNAPAQIGVQCVEEGRYIWGIPIRRELGDNFEEETRAAETARLVCPPLLRPERG